MPDLSPPREASPVIAQEFKVDEPCTLEVDLPRTYMHLRPGPNNNRVEVNISMMGCSPDRAEKFLNRMSVGTRQMKDRVRVYSDRPRWDAEWWRWLREHSATVYLDVRLPSQVDASVRTSGGTIDVANLAGNFDLEALGGTLQADNLDGTLDVRSRSSEVTVTRFDGARLNIHQAAGALSFEDVASDALTVRSVSAPVRLTEVRGSTDIEVHGAPLRLRNLSGTCRARTQGADLTYVGAPADDVELVAVGASLETQLPSSLSATLHLTGEEVSLDSGFSFEGKRTPQRVSGTLNDGGPTLRLRAVRGTAHCRTQ